PARSPFGRLSPRAAPPLALHSFPTRRSSDLADRDDHRRRLPPARGARARRGGGRDRAERRLAAAPARRRDRAGCSVPRGDRRGGDRKSTRLNSSHVKISYAVFCLKKKKKKG